MTRPAFESSLAALRDNVVMAIERREMGVVQDGLDVYKNLIEAILDEQLRLRAATGSETSPNLPLGREWDLILRDLHGVVDSVTASSSRLLWVDALSWVRSVAIACTDRAALNALSNILTLFESAWSQELAAPSRDATARQEALLLRLSELGVFYLGLRADGASARDSAVIYTRTFLQIVKHAIESGDVEAARFAIEYFLHGSTSPRSAMNPVTGAGLLALYAWILYRFDRGAQDDSFKAVCRQIANAFEGGESFLPLLRASDDLERELGFDWWELHGRGPMRGGFAQIGTYMSLALMLIGGAHLIWEPLDPASEDDVEAARRLTMVIDSIEQGGFKDALAALAVPDNHFSRLKEHLSDVIQQGDAVREEAYARLPVEPDRVTAFRTTLRQKLSDERDRSLTAALLTPADPSPEPVKTNFGLDALIPRSYFAETRVYADPGHLADELVRGLTRGEEDLILDQVLGDLSGATETTLDSLPAELEAALSTGQASSPVVVTNSYQAHALLTGRSVRSDGRSPDPITTAPVQRVYDDRPNYVALLAPQGYPTVHLLPPATHIEGDEILGDLNVIVGVSELSRQEMDDIVDREERTRIDKARLRGSLRVRVREHLEIAMAPGAHAMIWTVPDSSW